MRVVKPMSLGLLSRPFEFRRTFHLGVSVMAFLPIQDEPSLLPETAMWAFLGETLPPDMPLDAGMPKQGAEFLAIANAYAPGGQPVPSLRAGIQLGARIKTLNVTGDRLWDGGRASAPKPFTTMPIDWQHAYGGEGFAENPLGIGFDAVKATLDRFAKLPNIIEPARADGDYRRPAGFSAIDLMWPQRARLAGTHDDTWLKEDFPGFPRDIDWRFFSIAPEDQQFPQPLAGTESYAFENLHPERPLITGRLPGIAARAFVTRKNADGFEEVPLSLTTVWFFPDRLRMVLVHHGTVVTAEEDASDIEHLVIGADPVGTLRPAATFQEAMRLRTEKTPTGAARALDDGMLVPKDWVVPDPAIEAQQKLQQGEGIVLGRIHARQLHEREKMRVRLQEKGLDPEKHLPPPPENKPLPTPEEMPAFIEKLQADAADKKRQLEEKVQEEEAALTARGVDVSKLKAKREAKPKGPPSFTASGMRDKLQSEMTRLKGFGVPAAQIKALLADPQTAVEWEKAEGKVRDAYRMAAHHQDAADPVSTARSAEILGNLNNSGVVIYDLHGANLAGKDFSGRDLSGVCFDGADLKGCNFSRSKLSNAVLAHANLRGCNFDHAKLDGANLGKADLTSATFRGANLAGAILAGADLSGAKFDKAEMSAADIADAKLAGAHFNNARAPGLIIMKMSLRDWHAPGILLEKATFIESDLTGAVLHHACLISASFIGCKLEGVNFASANLTKAAFVSQCAMAAIQFSGADLSGACFRETAMSHCDFSRAILERADFSGADLTGALLPRVRAAGARFTAARLNDAKLNHGNFMNADLSRADLRGADLTECGFYEANLARVRLDESTRMAGMQTVRMRHLPRRNAP